MDPFTATSPLPYAERDDLTETVILSATEVSPVGAAVQPAACESVDEPPTTEPEILAAVTAVRHELMAANVDRARAMDLIARRAQFLTDAAGAVVELLEGTELVYRAATGSAARSLGLRVNLQKSLSGLCFRTGEVMRCDDVGKDDRVDEAACRWVGIRSMVLVPIGRAGVLAVISPGVGTFGERDVWTMRLLADVLAELLVPTVG